MNELQMKHMNNEHLFRVPQLFYFQLCFHEMAFQTNGIFCLSSTSQPDSDLSHFMTQFCIQWCISFYWHVLNSPIQNICVHTGWSIHRQTAMQVIDSCYKNLDHFSFSFSFMMSCSMEPNQFVWICWSPSSQLPLAATSPLLEKGWHLLVEIYVLHHTNQPYRCDDWNIKAENLSNLLCHLVDRCQFTLSLHKVDLECLSFLSFPQYQKSNCHLYHDTHGCARTASNPQLIFCRFID